METAETYLAKIDRIMVAQEEAVCSGRVNTALLEIREFYAKTYRVYPYRGDPYVVPIEDFATLLYRKFAPRLDRQRLINLFKVVQDLGIGELLSGSQYFPLQNSDRVLDVQKPVLKYLIDIDSSFGELPKVCWFIVSTSKMDFNKLTGERILIDG